MTYVVDFRSGLPNKVQNRKMLLAKCWVIEKQ